MAMRYCIQRATSVDVAFLASVMDETEDRWAADGEPMPVDRLLQTCACSTQVWAARDVEGTPTALWGVAPGGDDPAVGQLWMLAGEALDDDVGVLEALCRLVIGEMLVEFPRLENLVDARKVRAIAMLRRLGFTVEPALPQREEDGDLHRVWIDSDRLQGGTTVSRLPC
ncbi:MAG: hypothetical protein U1E23_17140 [Reyranellaceae bacterium]